MVEYKRQNEKSELTGGISMDLVMAIVVLLLSIVCAVISVLQFKEKGVLLNNAYIYASKQERENLDKTPHYRQSGIVFALISAIFFGIAAECILKTGWLWWIVSALAAAALVYAVVSSVKEQIKR